LVYGVASTIYVSSHLKSLRFFIHSYSFGLLGALVARMAFDPRPVVTVTDGLLLLGVALLAVVMMKFGKQLNRAHVNSLLLQYRNSQLIASLTQEKQTAIDAVATKNRLIASTAHDMRQPVLALDLYANWLAEDPDLTNELTPKITVATRAVIALFDSMFDLAQLAEGQVIVNLEKVNLKTLLEDLCTQHQAVTQNKRLELRTRLLDVDLLTDPLLLKRIIGNLIANAIKYTQTGGILVACRQTRRGLRIEVWDTGAGIAIEEQGLVFYEFYKSPTHAGTNDGFGLGLSIVTQLSDKLGYKPSMTSHPGRGTKMCIELNTTQSPVP
jgi:signal transduction histidine kinase